MTTLQLRLQAALASRYAIEGEIGRGGTAAVYRATDRKHDRPVALKVLHPDVAAPLGADRFLREIATTARLQHPHILPVHDSGEADGLLYYTMPLVDGESLRQRLTREGRLAIGQAVGILREVVGALAYAHDVGVVHRDVKPENVMLSGRHALLMDFGIAKALGEMAATGSMTAAGTAIGTPAYMAPEQATPGAGVDHRADIYAAGILAYEMLAGRTPFRGTTWQVLAAHAREAPPPLEAERTDVPEALAGIVGRCLEKRVEARWQSAADVLVRLDAVDTPPASGARRRPAALTVAAFRLTDEVCRRLDRASLDPRMIGGSLEYLDNQVESDTLLCCLHGTGLDHRDFEGVLAQSPFRAIAPTLYGWEPEARRRASLPLAAHIALVRAFLEDALARLQPARVIAIGYSAGGDFLLRMLKTPLEGSRRVDGLLSLDCNVSFDTCFVTRVLANMSIDEPARLLADLRHVGEHATTIEEWIKIHDYLVRILQKFHGDVGPLRRFAGDIAAPFEAAGTRAFVETFAAAAAAVPVVRCVFSDVDANNAALNQIKLENLDLGTLGPRYNAESLAIEPGSQHFDLKDPGLILRHVETVIAKLGHSGERA